MAGLAVIGNISCDVTCYPDGPRPARLGGAALHVCLAAARAGLTAAPVSVIGGDLAWIYSKLRMPRLDLGSVARGEGASCAFRLTYDERGQLVDVYSVYGVAEALTEHALTRIGLHLRYHVCCRQPLDAACVLPALVDVNAEFSVDFMESSAVLMIAAAAPYLPHSRFVFVNAAEYVALATITNPARVPVLVVTDGPCPVRLLRHGYEVERLSPPAIASLEVTGAGDTLAGTFLAAKAAGATDREALRQAVYAASTRVGTLDVAVFAGAAER